MSQHTILVAGNVKIVSLRLIFWPEVESWASHVMFQFIGFSQLLVLAAILLICILLHEVRSATSRHVDRGSRKVAMRKPFDTWC